MVRRRHPVGMICALALLLASIGIDLRASLQENGAGRSIAAAFTAKAPLLLPGPRRYPPGYRMPRLAGRNKSSLDATSHQTVMKS